MTKQRPVNLDLTSLKFPPMAIASILHRLSGILLFVLFPMMLCFLHQSLQSEAAYNQLVVQLSSPMHKVLLWAFLSALVYHVLAGIRHMIMDMGFGEGLAAGRRTAMLLLVVAAILIIFLGIWLW